MRPLTGIKVISMAGLSPPRFCGMVLSDFGADVVVVDRRTRDTPEIPNVMSRNPFDRDKRSIQINLKTEEGVQIVRRMIRSFDVLVEPYRPGTMERLGIGPDVALDINPKLIYARLTGWGREGPYADMAGHDINYIGLSGALSLFRRAGDKPLQPCNILGDFAGGGMLCAFGILLALIERNTSGKGQVVDSAMVDGAAYLATQHYGLFANDLISLDAGTNLLDSGAPYYQTYETADGGFMAVGAIEERFYIRLVEGLGIDPDTLPHQNDRGKWPEVKARFAEVFKRKTRDEWSAIFDGSDACVAPVLNLDEVNKHQHNRERHLLINIDGVLQPSPAPRLSRTPGHAEKGSVPVGAHTREILGELGYSEKEIKEFFAKQIVE